MSGSPRQVGGALLLYRRPISRWFRDALTIEDHIAAFARHSRFSVHAHNTELGYPRGLDRVRFDAVVMHYSLFGAEGPDYPFSPLFERYLEASEGSYKVAFFHDEHTACGKRFAFLNRHRFDCVFTLLEPSEFDKVYGAYTEVPKLVSHLPGYVSASAVEAGRRLGRPDAERELDVAFRARPLAPYMGVDDKGDMGRGFAERAAGTGLVTDIEVSDESLLPGEEWFAFMSRAKTLLGVESGTSCFDLEDEVRGEYERIAAAKGAENVTVADLRGGTLERWENRVHYRTIGPRNFEAAAMGVCQVLFEGRYSGLMEPMRHYIALRRDFSNFDEVVQLIRDPGLRAELAANAKRDLVDSGEHGFARLIESLDEVLVTAGLATEPSPGGAEAAERALRRSAPARAAMRLRSTLAYHPTLSRALWRVSRPVLGGIRRLRRARLERGTR